MKCLVCATTHKVLRFGLDVLGESGYRMAAGGIYLCERCWNEAAAVDVRRRKARLDVTKREGVSSP